MDISGKSAEASLSGGVCYSEDALNITARNDSTKRNLTIKYDYLCDMLHSKSYLTNETIQYGMFIAEVKKISYYKPNLKVAMTFAKADGWSNYWLVNVDDKSRCTNYDSYSL